MNTDFNLTSQPDINRKPLRIAFGKGRGFLESLDFIKMDKTGEFYQFEKGTIPVYVDKKNKLHCIPYFFYR